jgi:addiction module HigA family antidote
MSQSIPSRHSSAPGTECVDFHPTQSIDFVGHVDATAGSMNEPVPVHPGEVLQRAFLEPYGMTANKLATKLGVPPNSILAILHGTRGISGPMSILLGRAFGKPDDHFAALFSRYQVDLATQEAQQDLVAADRVARAQALARELHIG